MTYWKDTAIVWDPICKVTDEYWTDTGKLEISKKNEAKAVKVSMAIYSRMLELTDIVINDDNLLRMFSIPQVLFKPIKESWAKKELDLQGRFDFAFDDTHDSNFKLLEFNADTPSL